MTRTDAAGWLDLRAPDGLAWQPVAIPAADPPVRLARLHVDGSRLASLALVRFPPGWRRPGAGHYLAGEEFIVLAGALRVGDRDYRAGEWAWLPPGAHRGPSESSAGALALAWFSGPARWVAGPGAPTAGLGPLALADQPARVLRPAEAPVPGGSELATHLAPTACAAARDVLDVRGSRWCFVPAASVPPRIDATVFVRTWARCP